MSKERYRRGVHTVTDFKYHLVWKTKYSYGVLKGAIGLRLRDIIRDICVENKGLGPNFAHHYFLNVECRTGNVE